MIEYILAIVALSAMKQERPHFVAAVTTHEACISEANRLNQVDERLRSPELRALGAEYVCLKIVRGGA